MAGITNTSYCVKDNNEAEETEEQIYDSIEDESSELFTAFCKNTCIDNNGNPQQEQGSLNATRSSVSGASSVANSIVSADSNPEKLPVKQRHSASSRDSKTYSYDEVSINFGKPVLTSRNTAVTSNHVESVKRGGDVFDSVSFRSPIEDIDENLLTYPSLERCPSQLSEGHETSNSFTYENSNLVKLDNTINSNRPTPAPRNFNAKPSLQNQYNNVIFKTMNQSKSPTTSMSEPYDSKGRYEDIDCIEEYDTNNESNKKENNLSMEKSNTAMLIHPAYSDVHDSALSSNEITHDSDKHPHPYSNVTVVQQTSQIVKVENILTISKSVEEEEKDNILLSSKTNLVSSLVSKYSKPFDDAMLFLYSTNPCTSDHENIYTEIEVAEGEENKKHYSKSPQQSLIDMPTEEQQEEDDILTQLEDRPRAIPRTSLCEKISTIDIRKEVTQLYDEASKEVERDMSLDLDALEEIQETARQRRRTSESESNIQEEGKHVYEHVALSEPGAKFEIIDGKLIVQSTKPVVTLLRDFDPLLDEASHFKEMHSGEIEDTSEDEDEDTDTTDNDASQRLISEDIDGARALVILPSSNVKDLKPDEMEEQKCKRQKSSHTENIYSESPVIQRKQLLRNILDDDVGYTSDSESMDIHLDLPPPLSPPPPLPDSQPPPIPRRHPPYENVWLAAETNVASINHAETSPTNSTSRKTASPAKPPRKTGSPQQKPESPTKPQRKNESPAKPPRKTGSLFIPAKPSRPSIEMATIGLSSPKNELGNKNQKVKRGESFSSVDEEDEKEVQKDRQMVLRQNSEDSTSVISSVPPHDPKDQAETSDLSLQSLDEHSIEKKSGSTRSLSSLGKTFSQRVRRKSTNIYKKVLGTSRRASMSGSPSPKPMKQPSLGKILDEDFPESNPNRDYLSSVSSQKIAPRIHSSLLNDRKENHSGVLYFKAKKSFTVKWCVLSNVDFSYFNEQYSLGVPKEQISLYSIISLTRHVETKNDEGGENVLYCFDVAFSAVGPLGRGNYSSGAKYVVRTFGATTIQDCDTWIDRITQSLSPRLATFTMTNHTSSSRLSWVHIKTGFAGEWNTSWICISGHLLRYTSTDADEFQTMDELNLKKITNITLVKDVKNLQAPEPFPVLVIDYVDRSLYLMPVCEKECSFLQNIIELALFNNGDTLDQQQLTKDDIPVAVDKCIKFVYGQGCLTEGIYRISGVNKRIETLLEEFRKNAWGVTLNREMYTEHDVANVLKRFMRKLNEPLLTQNLRSEFIETSKIDEEENKIKRYTELLGRLPRLNYNTLRRLIMHLRCISDQNETNKMTTTNLSALWGPTLLTVDGEIGGAISGNFSDTSSEADVCIDLLENFLTLFNVDSEELKREDDILVVLKKVHLHDKGKILLNPSGDLKMWVYVDSKSGGRCVQLVVYPKMTALEMVRNVLRKIGNPIEAENHVLHEVILQGNLERPIHHKEIVFDTTLKWGTWPEQDRRDNYLLLKKINPFYEEALPSAVPPLSVYGEARFGGNTKKKQLSGFKKHQFSISNARLVCSREGNNSTLNEVASWPIEDIWWYFGCEPKRQAPFHYNLTFISKQEKVERTKDRPFFGNIISFEYRGLFTKWVAAMLVAEYSNDIKPPPQLLLID